MKSKSSGFQKTKILFGFDRSLERFVPSREPSWLHEACIESYIHLPKYISNDFFITHYYKLTFMKRYGFSFTALKSEQELNRLLQLSGISLFIAVKLLDTRKKSAFFTSCKASLRKWIVGDLDYDHPWSGKQMSVLEQEFQNEYKIKFHAVSRNLNVISSFA